MTKTLNRLAIVFCLFLVFSCDELIERSGVVVDNETSEPIEGVAMDIYMKYQRDDSLAQRVVTDKNGHFAILEKRDIDESFQFMKEGYIGFVSSIAVKNDRLSSRKHIVEPYLFELPPCCGRIKSKYSHIF